MFYQILNYLKIYKYFCFLLPLTSNDFNCQIYTNGYTKVKCFLKTEKENGDGSIFSSKAERFNEILEIVFFDEKKILKNRTIPFWVPFWSCREEMSFWFISLRGLIFGAKWTI
jgi:hypothetical protein